MTALASVARRARRARRAANDAGGARRTMPAPGRSRCRRALPVAVRPCGVRAHAGRRIWRKQCYNVVVNGLEGLNPAQRDAVIHERGPLLILAGAGSGKTRVITFRIAELLRRGTWPERILAVTFTNKAAGEMRERIEKLTSGRARGMWVGTFHATCARLLRMHSDRVGLGRDFVIFDDNDQRTLVSRVLKDLGIADRFATPRAMLSAIDGAKNRGEGPDELQGHDYFSDLVARVYPVYQQRLEQANGVDFGDLLLKSLKLCRDPVVGPKLADKFDHVLVDEFQDTNRVQYDLVNHLSARTTNLCVVGDDDQSIYSWRGADVRNILDFERDHPQAVTVKLEQNYRSTQVILDAANGVIARNLERKDKRLFTEKSGGELVRYQTAEDERSEAQLVVRSIQRLCLDDGRAPADFAVFYRTHAQSRALEEALLGADLPYAVIGGIRFYDRAEVKDLLGYLRVLANPADEISLERVVNKPTRGIGESTYERVVARARAESITVWQAMEAIARAGDSELSPAPRKKLAGFIDMMDDLRNEFVRHQGSLGALADAVLERTQYLERLAADGTHESQERIENLLELTGSIKDYEGETFAREGVAPTIHDYLEQVSLVAPSDAAQKGVTLMTVHAAKGLEFPVVFVTGLEDGVFPSLRNGEDQAALEEERRLAYVAMTRAEERLFLTNARARRLYGQDARPFRESRFLADIPEHCLERPVNQPRGRPGWMDRGHDDVADDFSESHARKAGFGGGSSAAAQNSRTVERDGGISVEYDGDGSSGAVEDDVEGIFRMGQRVRHPKFGEGEVRGFTGSGADLKLTVYFPKVGPKTIVARFVELA
jgi:DNA helicase-2/ATP-dependent DNA helicase PcrA